MKPHPFGVSARHLEDLPDNGGVVEPVEDSLTEPTEVIERWAWCPECKAAHAIGVHVETREEWP